MQLYRTYLKLWREGDVCAGFSPRLPDYAIRFWLEKLEQAFPLGAKSSFLDIGAGDGRLSLLLLHTYSPQGMAIEVQMNKKAWEPMINRYSRFEVYDGLLQDALAQKIGLKKFDFILLSEVFEHIPLGDVKPFLAHLHTVLADHGTIFLTTPNRIVQGEAEKSSMWHEITPYGHHKHYTYDELNELFTSAGFNIVSRNFECHKIKTLFYNKLFYRCSRLDARFLQSAKIPLFIKKLYRYMSTPMLPLVNFYFWSVAQLIYGIEKKYSNEKTAATILLTITKLNLFKVNHHKPPRSMPTQNTSKKICNQLDRL